VARTSTAAWKNPSARAGSKSERRAGHTPAAQPSNPPDRTQPSVTEKNRMSSRPDQNCGIEMPSWETIIAR
jgi:hypothetical protein